MSKYGIRLPLRITRASSEALRIVDSSDTLIACLYYDAQTTRRMILKHLEPQHAEEIAKLIARALTIAVQREGEEG